MRSTSACGRAFAPARLIVPLDTHVIRVGRCLRLTRYTSPGWRMARDITAVAAAPRSGRPGQVRLLALPPRDDERVRHGSDRRRRRNSQCLTSVRRSAGRRVRTRPAVCGDHPLDGEALADAREPGLAHPPAPPVVLQRAHDRGRQRRGVARRHQQAVDAVLDDFRNAAGAGRDDRPRRRPSRRAATCPSPSVTELMTNRSKPLMQPSTSVRNPGSSTCFSRWCSCTCFSRCSRSSPSPRMTKRASGICCTTRCAASIR